MSFLESEMENVWGLGKARSHKVKRQIFWCPEVFFWIISLVYIEIYLPLPPRELQIVGIIDIIDLALLSMVHLLMSVYIMTICEMNI